MTEIQFSFIMPQVPPDRAQRSRFVEDLNRALELVGGRFESARISDHLMINIELDDLESFTTLAYLAALHPPPIGLDADERRKTRKKSDPG